ncbi:MAG: transglutaminase family protein [Betaproteobacteria bacterium]|nr:transglutaminase family protein [Betaproteobacteria bacterium]
MSVILQVEHSTIYRYHNPVTFGEHRLMFRPRTSHDMRVLEVTLDVSPRAQIRWIHDVFSNSVTLLDFEEPAAELRVDCRVTIEHFGASNLELPISPAARSYPFDYPADERIDLQPYIEPRYPDPEGAVRLWAHQWLVPGQRMDTRELLRSMMLAIRERFVYLERFSEGTQPPAETLRLGTGTCRDFALLMMESVRHLGMAARFVSGYLYDPALDGGAIGMVGAGATHAWLQVYLPGAGWVPFDPTNTLYGGTELVRVAYARDPVQASPLAGTWTGLTGDFAGMEVNVTVRKLGETPATAPVEG